MIRLEVDDSVVMQQSKVLEQALSTNPKTQKALQELIRKTILDVRAKMERHAGQAMERDPRGSRHSIRTSVYKKILGANINIYNSQKNNVATSPYEPPRTLRPGQRGGNRRERSQRTQDMMTKYGPYSRGFILRWLNEGTQKRAIKRLVEVKRPKSGSKFVWKANPDEYGNRGTIRALHWFKNAGESEIRNAIDVLATLIDDELEKMLEQKTK